MEKQIEFLVKLRDASQMMAEAANEYLETFAPATGKEDKQTAAVQEITFATLRFEAQQGAKLGEYEIAYKSANLEDKWRPAYNILHNSNATIKDRYHGEGYQYSYWLYGEDRIYRQKLKPKP
ncbi:MAG: hypothetical protein NWE94_06830 [Candidatus Bathyarchaeota archaeon]|nr:hypothetical protein [Candidatus Bathyarchaeota archaeon]